MLHGKVGGMFVGGLAAYLIIGKLVNTFNHTVQNVCEASKWKSYYKYGKDGNMVPPGYSSHTHKINDDEELVVEDESQVKKPEKPNASASDLGATIADSIIKVIRDKLHMPEAAEGPLEGEIEASEDEDYDIPDPDAIHVVPEPEDGVGE